MPGKKVSFHNTPVSLKKSSENAKKTAKNLKNPPKVV
jgi:hypothetical protein